jgi:hypothetical protein
VPSDREIAAPASRLLADLSSPLTTISSQARQPRELSVAELRAARRRRQPSIAPNTMLRATRANKATKSARDAIFALLHCARVATATTPAVHQDNAPMGRRARRQAGQLALMRAASAGSNQVQLSTKKYRRAQASARSRIPRHAHPIARVCLPAEVNWTRVNDDPPPPHSCLDPSANCRWGRDGRRPVRGSPIGPECCRPREALSCRLPSRAPVAQPNYLFADFVAARTFQKAEVGFEPWGPDRRSEPHKTSELSAMGLLNDVNDYST